MGMKITPSASATSMPSCYGVKADKVWNYIQDSKASCQPCPSAATGGVSDIVIMVCEAMRRVHPGMSVVSISGIRKHVSEHDDRSPDASRGVRERRDDLNHPGRSGSHRGAL